MRYRTNASLSLRHEFLASLKIHMKIIIKAKPGAKEDRIEKVDETNYIIYVKAPPIDGKANAAIIKLLAEHFDISQSLVEIISGHMARVKVIEIHN